MSGPTDKLFLVCLSYRMEDKIIIDRLSEMCFRVYSEEEIVKLSVKEITNPQLFDNLQLPTVGGLYDPDLGSSRNDEVCTSCGLSGRHCPGHMGHIKLVLPVFNPNFFKTLLKILQGSCLSCHRLFMSRVEGMLFVHQMQLLEKGNVVGAKTLRHFVWEYQAEKGGEECVDEEDLIRKVQRLAKKLMKDSTASLTQCTKMADSEMSLLVQSMLKQFFTTFKVCPHCRTDTVVLRQEYFSRITARSGTKRRSKVNATTPKGKPSKALTLPPPTEEDQKQEDEEDAQDLNEVDYLLEKGKGQCLIMPHLAQQILRKVWKNEGKVLAKVFSCLEEISGAKYPTDLFFLTALLVPPSRFRPLSVMGDRKFENPQTANLSRVLTDNSEIQQLLAKMNLELNKSTDLTVDKEDTSMEDLQMKWIQLQTHVNCLMDSDLDKLSADNMKIPGVRQLLEKKEGLFRMHMMGKRVNYAARSVISPDPCINTNQIGVPDIFAKKLTYPQPVTPWNVHELRQYVINGPNNYPGAVAVVNEDGNVTKLSSTSQTQREAIAKQLLTPGDTSGKPLLPKQVLRHLRDGDVLLLNRQPTLHRPSIQAHRARVLPGLKTLRLHYSNCKAYNADFDGDEMNAHFPQSELCRAEAYNIASTDFQYLVPKDGTPLAGLIQDHLVAGVALTIRGQFFNRDDYFNLLQSALTDKSGKLQLLPASIIKPCQMWSGKQVISTLLLNIIPKDRVPLSMEGKAKIKEKSWIQRNLDSEKHHLALQMARMTEDLGESTVVIVKGELLQGVLDKAHCGPSSYGLVHCVYELYGGEVAGKLLTCMGRLFTAFLKLRGFTLGIEDILVRDQAEKRRKKKIRKAPKEGHRAALEAFGMAGEDCSDAHLLHMLKEAQFGKDDMAMKQLDNSAKKVTNDVSEKISLSIIGEHLYKSFPDNNLQLMVQSGAKGGSVNCIQISSMLGQIELEGRRPPLMSSGRSLPSFLPYDLSLKAGGFVTGRFLTGIRPQEYFFHCMAGREGLIDTAVKTSRSGYLQRCLVKHLEGLTVHYDMTVRDSDASVVQFLYGEDGLEVGKTPFLETQQFPFLLKNQHVLSSLQGQAKETKPVKKYKKKIDKWKKKNPDRKTRESGFLEFSGTKAKEVRGHQVNGHSEDDADQYKSPASKAVEVQWRGLDEGKKYKFMKKHLPCVDPVLSKFWPQQHAGVISENMQDSIQLIQQQLTEVGETLDERRKEQSLVECQVLQNLVYNKVMKSLAQPGEAVGLLCAQSIGEPSTQMTLNTFHFAGRGEMNVTLGIPRLREILMTASANILTPCMEIPILDVPGAQEEVEKLQRRLSCVHLNEVLQEVRIHDFLHSSSPDGSHPIGRKRLYRIHFRLLPKECYSDKLKMKPKEIIRHIERQVIGQIARVATRLMDKRAKERPEDLVSQATERSMQRNDAADIADDSVQADDADSDVDVGDGDTTSAKAMARHTDTQEYEGEDEEREEVGDATQADDLEGTEETQDTDGDDSDIDLDESQDAKDIQVVKSMGFVHDYTRDKKRKWCEVVLRFNTARFLIDMKSVVERAARQSVLQEVKGIKRCMLLKQADRFSGRMRPHLVTEGINLQEVMKYSHILDLNCLYTNNIHEVEAMYGIEAANTAVVKEVKSVFKPYEIQVNPRHLSLLADYMTCEGTYKGFNRAAIASNPSPLQKITFETSMNFLVNSCTHGRPDQLQSPSARIVAGQVVSSGTGSFEIVQPLEARTSRA